jgi:hypothetical protein
MFKKKFRIVKEKYRDGEFYAIQIRRLFEWDYISKRPIGFGTSPFGPVKLYPPDRFSSIEEAEKYIKSRYDKYIIIDTISSERNKKCFII